jgi:hypothetical protein
MKFFSFNDIHLVIANRTVSPDIANSVSGSKICKSSLVKGLLIKNCQEIRYARVYAILPKTIKTEFAE